MLDDILFVFDGAALECKMKTNENRMQERSFNLELAQKLEASGDRKQANTHYQRSISISQEMIACTCAFLQKKGVQYLISPFESDAQLAYLSIINTVDIIFTEDSDSIGILWRISKTKTVLHIIIMVSYIRIF